MGLIYSDKGLIDKALKNIQIALEICISVLGIDHPDTKRMKDILEDQKKKKRG